LSDHACTLLVIGAGPGGYVCAIRAGQLGVNTIIVDPQPLGGTCLNVGCIPSKAVIHAADEFYKLREFASDVQASVPPLGISASSPAIDYTQTCAWKDGIVSRLNAGVELLLKKAGVKHLTGKARFRDGKTVVLSTTDGEQQIRAENIVVATGSEPVELASLPFGGNIISSTEALALTSVPKSLAVVGGGYIGLELGTAFAKLGTTVSVVESEDNLLPHYDAALVKPVVQRLGALGVNVLTNTLATTYDPAAAQLTLESKTGDANTLTAEKVLVTVGRRPRLAGWGLSELSLTLNDGFIAIDNKCQTSMRGVYAIGDVTGEPMLAHRAMAQGEMVAELVASQSREWDKVCIPAVCFTDPEIVTVGITANEAKEQGLSVSIAEFPFQANGRAMSVAREDGFIRVVTREDNHAIVGIHAVGAGISELSASFSLAIEMGARAEDVAATVHAHPTQSEGFQEACLKALGHALHI